MEFIFLIVFHYCIRTYTINPEILTLKEFESFHLKENHTRRKLSFLVQLHRTFHKNRQISICEIVCTKISTNFHIKIILDSPKNWIQKKWYDLPNKAVFS
jgi:hypothetical protein